MFRAERIPAHLVCMVVKDPCWTAEALSFPCGPCAWCSVSQIEAPHYTVVQGTTWGTDFTDAVFSEAHSARLVTLAPVSLPSLAQGCQALKTQPSLLNEEVSKLAVRLAWI